MRGFVVMEEKLKVFAFRAMGGCYTSGAVIAVAQTKDDAVRKILDKFSKDQHCKRCDTAMYKRYSKVFPSEWDKQRERRRKDQCRKTETSKTWVQVATKQVPNHKISDPVEKWECVWNSLVDKGKIPAKQDADKKIYNLLKKVLPCGSGNNTGTWRGNCEQLKTELQECTLENKRLVVSEISCFAYYQGGGD